MDQRAEEAAVSNDSKQVPPSEVAKLKTQLSNVRKQLKTANLRLDDAKVMQQMYESEYGRRGKELAEATASLEESKKREELAKKVKTESVASLEEEVRKLKEQFQRACVAARTAELRAEQAETLLDDKRGLIESQKMNEKVEELEKKLAELSCQLEVANRSADSARIENNELTRKNEELMAVMTSMKADGEEMRREGEEMKREREEMEREREETQKRLAEMAEKIAQFEKEKEEKETHFPEEVRPPEDTQMDSMMDDSIENSFNEAPLRDEIANESSQRDIVGNESQNPLDATIEEEIGEDEETVNQNDEEAQEDSSENVEVERRKRPTRSGTKSAKYAESVEDSEGEEELPAKKTRSESAKKGEKATPQCVLCEAYPSTVLGYASHLQRHGSSLKLNDIYLICSCGCEVRSSTSNSDHSKKCGGTQFTLHKLIVENHTTPQCVMCEAYPSTARGFAAHLELHKSSLKLSGIYLVCSCGNEVRSSTSNPDHTKKCDGTKFTLHKLSDENHTTPQCVMCEAYPSTALGYANHLNRHKSSLNLNGIYLVCSCGHEVRSSKGNPDHTKKCDGTEFTIHQLSKEVPTTPQCVLCETYPVTTRGYAQHLCKRHNSSLRANEIYLICSCGLEIRSDRYNPDHSKCDSTQFTIHKLGEK